MPTSEPVRSAAAHAPITSLSEGTSTVGATIAALPKTLTDSPTGSSKGISQNLDALEKVICGTYLHQYIRNAKSTFQMTHNALKTMGSMFIEKFKENPLAACIGALFYGVSLFAQAAIKAVIWLPIIVGTFVVGAAGVLGCTPLLMLAMPLIGTDAANVAMKDMLKASVHIAGAVLGGAATVVAGLSIVARWPLVLTSRFGAWCLESNKLMDPKQRAFNTHLLTLSAHQAFQDTLNLWTGGKENIWASLYDSIDLSANNKTSGRLILALLKAGMNPYSKAWNGEYELRSMIPTHFDSKEAIDVTIEQIKRRVAQIDQEEASALEKMMEELAPAEAEELDVWLKKLTAPTSRSIYKTTGQAVGFLQGQNPDQDAAISQLINRKEEIVAFLKKAYEGIENKNLRLHFLPTLQQSDIEDFERMPVQRLSIWERPCNKGDYFIYINKNNLIEIVQATELNKILMNQPRRCVLDLENFSHQLSEFVLADPFFRTE